MNPNTSNVATPTVKSGAEQWTEQPLRHTREWAPGLISFTVERAPDFIFSPGQFARLTLGKGEEAVSRAYSIASAPREPVLEFLAVLIPDGAFSKHLAQLQPGNTLRVSRTSYGFFTADNFTDGRDLWLLATGTGLAPFISMLRDGAILRRFEHVVLVHSVKLARSLAYRNEIADLVDKVSPNHLRYVPITSQETVPGLLHGRITRHIMDGQLEATARLVIDEHHSRLMICGNPQMCAELRHHLPERGLRINRTKRPGQLIFENYW
ncbi:MAG TPA: ferredoxin--NADP reductase [Rhodocyclaceae bacterium]|nr:ferredoxin--NADP reductase [Rhodocyclaceae bacterium]